MWVFVRTSTNFAHLASFQAIEFVDWPIPKMLDILGATSEYPATHTLLKSAATVVLSPQFAVGWQVYVYDVLSVNLKCYRGPQSCSQ